MPCGPKGSSHFDTRGPLGWATRQLHPEAVVCCRGFQAGTRPNTGTWARDAMPWSQAELQQSYEYLGHLGLSKFRLLMAGHGLEGLDLRTFEDLKDLKKPGQFG